MHIIISLNVLKNENTTECSVIQFVFKLSRGLTKMNKNSRFILKCYKNVGVICL